MTFGQGTFGFVFFEVFFPSFSGDVLKPLSHSLLAAIIVLLGWIHNPVVVSQQLEIA